MNQKQSRFSSLLSLFATAVIMVIGISDVSLAETSGEILKRYESEQRQLDPNFKKFSEAEGKEFYYQLKQTSQGKTTGCSDCHTKDPKSSGKSRAGKVIDPIAPIAQRDRFTDLAKVEKWFGRNCKDVLERECTIKEKGIFIQYLLNIK